MVEAGMSAGATALIDDPQLTARIEEIATRVADERIRQGSVQHHV
jgi:riboflavin biosynthesis pyrimidine reductase